MFDGYYWISLTVHYEHGAEYFRDILRENVIVISEAVNESRPQFLQGVAIDGLKWIAEVLFPSRYVSNRAHRFLLGLRHVRGAAPSHNFENRLWIFGSHDEADSATLTESENEELIVAQSLIGGSKH